MRSRLVEGFRAALRRERLPDPPAAASAAPPGDERPPLLRSIFAPEVLPLDPEPPREARPGRGLAGMLFGADPLPEDPPRPSPPRHHWIDWLLAPERIDDR